MKLLKNNLDEMQEQTLKKSESIGLYLALVGLAAAMLIQGFMGAPPVQMAGEFFVFEGLCIYMIVASLRNGIWDRYLKPSIKTNVIASFITGIAVFFISYSIVAVHGYAGADVVKEIAVVSVCTSLFCFVGMVIFTKFYKKRREKLDQE